MGPTIKEMVTPLTFARSDDELIDALRSGHPGAAAVFYDRYATSVHRTLQSVLGRDAETGLIPADRGLLARVVRDVCFFNARNYFTLELADGAA